MNTLDEFFRDRGVNGVFAITRGVYSKELDQFAEKRQLRLMVVKGATINTKADFLAGVALDLKFPDYFGGNWDALYDMLTDFDVLGAKGVMIVVLDADSFQNASPQDFDAAIDIFKDAADFWKQQGVSFLVLLLGATYGKLKSISCETNP